MNVTATRLAAADSRRILIQFGWLAALLVLPFLIGPFFVGAMASVYIWAIAGIGMMVLLGYSGQVSIGHAAFLAMGAYGEALLVKAGVPFPLSALFIVVAAFGVGVLVGLPSLRFSGLYLAMATFAFAFIVEALIGALAITGGWGGMRVEDVEFLGYRLADDWPMYYVSLTFAAVVYWMANNLVRSKTGRAWQAIRDTEIAAAAIGVEIARYKTIAFAFSAACAAMAGTLIAHKVGYLSPDGFTIQQSIELLILVVVGGVGSLLGAIYGAFFLVLLPIVLSIVKNMLPDSFAQMAGLEAGVFGLALMLVILFQPGGINGAVEQVLRRLGVLIGYSGGRNE